MDKERLVPEGAHVAFMLGRFTPFDPSECNPKAFKENYHHLRGDLQGVVVPHIETEMASWMCGYTQETALRYARESVKERLLEAKSDGGVESLYPIPEDCGDIPGTTMTREEVQAEIDDLRQKHSLEVPVGVVFAEKCEDAAATTTVLGLPFADKPHKIIVAFAKRTLMMKKPSLRYIIRHEFAHCLAEARGWKEEMNGSVDHGGDEWDGACSELGISATRFGMPHELGCYHCWCPHCGFGGYQLRFENDEGYERRCDECGAYLEREEIDETLSFAEDMVYFLEEDGRLAPSGLPADDFFGLVPECFSD